MIKKQPVSILLLLIFYLVFIISCKKNTFITGSNATLAISADTLQYDTVFTTVGSITQIFTITNTNNQQLLLSTVKLMGGTNSAYKININGMPGPEANNITIAANDSIHVFVTVTINPNNASLPFIVRDSILISYNNNNTFVQLQAYGQNAHFLNGSIIKGNVTWANDLPYVILDSLQVDTAAVLTMQQGCRVYLHSNAPFLVDGTLIINGTSQDSVIFNGDRLDVSYANLPASWPGIYFRGTSIDNVLTHAVIENSNQGIYVGGVPADGKTKLTLHRCIINNAYQAGILCYNTSMQADNCLISNCSSNIELTYGGNYSLINCTVASYGNEYISHTNPVLQVNNYDTSTGTLITNPTLSAVFQNCIFWGDYGNVNDEVVVSEPDNSNYNIHFTTCLYKAVDHLSNSTFDAVDSALVNMPPGFDSIDVVNNVYNFHINSGPGNGLGTAPIIVTDSLFDLDDNPRTIAGKIDIGCYENQP